MRTPTNRPKHPSRLLAKVRLHPVRVGYLDFVDRHQDLFDVLPGLGELLLVVLRTLPTVFLLLKILDFVFEFLCGILLFLPGCEAM